MTENDNPMTKESIDADKEESKKLDANQEELTKLIHELAQKRKKIEDINQAKKQLHPPSRPVKFNLQHNYNREWTEYFDKAEKYICEKEEQKVLEEQLANLNAEREGIEAKIRPLVPPNFHGIQIMADDLRLTVNEKSMIIIKDKE